MSTMFRPTFLLNQYSFICVQYFKCSDTRVNKTAVCFNNIAFILVAKIRSKKVCDKLENNSTLEKALLVCNRNVELLRLVEATCDSKMATLRRIMKKDWIILKSLQKKSLPCFYLFVCRCWHLSCQISTESVRKICNMLTERTYDSLLYLKSFSIL